MQAFQAQRTEEFLSQVGSLLTEAVAEAQTPWQQRAMHELGAYIYAARSAQGIPTDSFARQLALSETEMYALEQGIFPYARLTLPLLEQIAVACREEKDVLLALLHGAQHQPAPQPSVPTGALASGVMPTQHRFLESHQQSTAKTQAEPQKHKIHKRFLLPMSLLLAELKFSYSEFSHTQLSWGRRLLHKIAASLSLTWKVPTLNLPHPAMSMVVALSLCYFALLHFALLPGNPFSPTEISVVPFGTTLVPTSASTHPDLAEAGMALPGVKEINREGHNAEGGRHRTTQRDLTAVNIPTTHPYRIIYTTDTLSDQRVVSSPLIPVSGNELAFIQTEESIPQIFYLCRVIGQMESCPM